MSETIVVGVDGSQHSAVALDWAVETATIRAASLRIVHALHMPLVGVPFGGASTLPPSDGLRAHADDLLVTAARRAAAGRPGLEVRTELSLHSPADALIRASREATMIVLGTRGLGTIGSAFLGSVGIRVASHARCPTAIVPSPMEPAEADAPILAGVDGSEHSAAAVRFALDEAHRRSTRVVAMHAYAVPMYAFPVEDPTLIDQFNREVRANAESLVADVVDRELKAFDHDVAVDVRAVDAVATESLVEAGRNALMTVVGSRGRAGFRGMLLGSVSQSVLHHSRRPVVVVHARS